MKRAAAVVMFLLAAALMPGRASANVPTDPDTTCVADGSMFCAINGQPRAEGPAYINYVGQVDGYQQFCTLDRRGAPTATCHPYWPFVNPVVNADQAPASAFTSARMVASESDMDGLRAEIQKTQSVNMRQARVIDVQAQRIQRLEARVAKLQHRLHRH